ncbi:hypothetical protein PMAYCL1PPCAC_27089 [Pristionchus mayeri]|uniref:Uncharacterized protein n=1 Tax=Pristionchus mayeri TaxID=1317129 RepID=A0AAN5I9X5_9BILA|nr:hypothetical protein PMAYCL1PPCAC_27089 [Pristionchus mayeri]
MFGFQTESFKLEQCLIDNGWKLLNGSHVCETFIPRPTEAPTFNPIESIIQRPSNVSDSAPPTKGESLAVLGILLLLVVVIYCCIKKHEKKKQENGVVAQRPTRNPPRENRVRAERDDRPPPYTPRASPRR